jgi:serine/threonine protein kinase
MRRCKMNNKEKESKETIRADSNVISSGVSSGRETQKDSQQIIPAVPTTQIISAGIVSAPGGEINLNGKDYKILKTISRSTGEAEVYLVERENKKFIFKYYYPAFKPKDEVLKQLKNVTHEDIIDLIDYGYYQDRFFEILEYAEGGSLLETNPDGTYKYIPIKDVTKIKQIVKEVVNALKFCHDKGIIHRDLKPGNIFFTNPDGTDIQIGDFGISSVLAEGLSKVQTGYARTEIYAAPELYQTISERTIIGKEVDYYALGITLLHIWSGEEPFKGLTSLAIMKVKCDGKVYIPEDMPKELETLIKGLITVEPSKRWGYEEVQKWLRGEYVPVYYKTVEFNYEQFAFGIIEGKEVFANNPRELADLLLKYPEMGKKHLYKKRIQKWLEKANDPVFTEIEKIVEDEYPNDEDAGLIKAVYVLDPLRSYKTSAGRECRTTEELGDAIENEALYYRNYLTQKKNADLFLYLEAHGAKDVADAFRKYAQAYTPERAFNMMILDLQMDKEGNKIFKIDNFVFYKPEDLLLADDKIKDKLVQLLKNPDSKLSIWLEQFPKLKNNIDKWRKLGRHTNITLSYALLEGSPFKFEDAIAKDVADFKSLFLRYLTEKDFLEKIKPDSFFFKEADFWLKNYHNTDFYKVIIACLTTKSKAPLTDEEKQIWERLAVFWIEKAHSERDISKRDRIINILEKIEPNHRWVIREKKEKKLIDIMMRNKMEELSNKENEELKKIEEQKKLAEENSRMAFKEKEYSSLWNEDGKKAFFTGIGTAVLWMLFLAQGGFHTGKPGILTWIGAIVGGIIGLAEGGLVGAIIGLGIGVFLAIISPFIISAVFLYFLIKVIIEIIRINKESLQIKISDEDKKKFKQWELDIRNKIEEERENFKKEILNEILGMDDETIEKSLESLMKS